MWWFIVVICIGVKGIEIPGDCGPTHYYDPALFSCQVCAVNASMVKSSDGFGCSCNDYSIPSGPDHCRLCSATEVLSSDGTACVPRKCQNISGRVACRKCPADFISVTQNLDGSPMREVQCIKCARGFKPQRNTCVRCESCTCSKAQVVVRGICVPKVYVNARPTYSEKILHPLELLDIVKYEYLCTRNDSRMCRTLANECVKNFYTSDLGGPCRLWLQRKLAPIGLPPLIVNETNPGEMSLPRGKGKIKVVMFVFTTNGGMFILDERNKQLEPCQLSFTIQIGNDITSDCNLNISKLSLSGLNETLSPYVLTDGEYKPIPVSLIKPSGFNVQAGSWSKQSFSRYFMIHRSPSVAANTTYTVYLRTMLIKLKLQRDSHANGSLRLQIKLEAQYAAASQELVVTTVTVEHLMPSAGVLQGLQVWGGALGSFFCLYALVQWRGALRRGAPHFSLGPLLAGAAADTLYFAALLSSLHALAAEAGTLGITLPLSRKEEKIIRDFIISAVALKVVKICWINWKQCNVDIFFINWAEYNPPVVKANDDNWKATTLSREWSRLQTMRRACPGFTVAGALLFLHFMSPWQINLPPSKAYNWTIASIAWWCSYALVIITSYLVDRFMASPAGDLPKVCSKVDLSLLVFQEEFYAHYVHGRNNDFQEARSMAGPLATCRVACVPKLRAVCRQLSAPTSGVLGETESRQMLLSKFLAAFFERALDGLNWVASERTLLERALDIEVTSREAGATSALLYDDDHTPSCFAVTWWGEEWNLSTFDAMLFSAALFAIGDALLAALTTITTWQLLKQMRSYLGSRNQVLKTGVDIQFH